MNFIVSTILVLVDFSINGWVGTSLFRAGVVMTALFWGNHFIDRTYTFCYGRALIDLFPQSDDLAMSIVIHFNFLMKIIAILITLTATQCPIFILQDLMLVYFFAYVADMLDHRLNITYPSHTDRYLHSSTMLTLTPLDRLFEMVTQAGMILGIAYCFPGLGIRCISHVASSMLISFAMVNIVNAHILPILDPYYQRLKLSKSTPAQSPASVNSNAQVLEINPDNSRINVQSPPKEEKELTSTSSYVI